MPRKPTHRHEQTPPATPAVAAEMPDSAPETIEHVEGGLTIGRSTALGFTVARWEERLAVALATLLLFVFLTQSYGDQANPGSWNDQSRFATIQSLVEDGTFAIDNTRWGWWTGDKVFAGQHFYSTKPPLLSVLGAGVYYPLHHVLGLSYFNDAQAPTIYYVVTLVLIGLPMALAAMLFYDLLARFGLQLRWRILGVAGFVLGSLYLPYSTIFQNHTVAGIAGLGSFAALVFATNTKSSSAKYVAFAGLGVAIALATDIVGGAPYAAGALGWLGWRLLGARRSAIELSYFALGMLGPLAIHFLSNLAITGDFEPVYTKAETYRLTNVKGLFGEVLERQGYFSTLLDPYRWRYIFNSLFGIRGIFLYTPTLLLGIWAAWRLTGDRWKTLGGVDQEQWPALAWWTRGFLAMTLISWGYLLLRTENYGGTSYGSRYFIPPMAVLLLFAALVYSTTIGTARARGWYAEALRLAIIMSIAGTFFPWGVLDLSGTPTNFSFVANLKAYTQNALQVLLVRAGLG